MKQIIAKRVPPGDRWSIENDEAIHPSLTDCLNAIYMVMVLHDLISMHK